MNRKKILSTVLAAAVMMTMATGCSKEDEGAIKLSEKYLDSVLSADFDEMTDMLDDDDGISDYSLDDRSFTGLAAVLGYCDYEQKEYRGGKDEITIGYTLSLPDLEDISGNEYACYADLIDSLAGFGEAEYEMEITLVPKNDKWIVKDADSALELYEDILDGLSEAEFDYILGYEGVLAVLDEEIPDVAEEFRNTAPQYGEYNYSEGGLQIIVGTYQSAEAAYELFSFIAEVHGSEIPSEDVHYCFLNANGHAAGILWRDTVVVQIYDTNGTHENEVNTIFEELKEMV